ncbi:MAG TPA: hypothetical protein VHM90_20910 [Phycisphaerae bacterium]|jgi:hypothetical protein|nr:hypothetical protein [Phycisphaerae bacterium]
MTTAQIEKRLTALEAEVASLKSSRKAQNPWWDKIAGAFADNPRFERAMRQAREDEAPPRSKSRRSGTNSIAARKAAR